MSVAFDFDDTLCKENGYPILSNVRRFRQHQAAGHIVHIVTARYPDELRDVYQRLAHYKLYPDSVVATSGTYKSSWLLELDVRLFYDDNPRVALEALSRGIMTFTPNDFADWRDELYT